MLDTNMRACFHRCPDDSRRCRAKQPHIYKQTRTHMCTHVHFHKHTYIHAHTRTVVHAHTFTIVLTPVCTYIQVHTHAYTRIPTQSHTQTSIQEHTHTHARARTRAHTHIHIHVSKHAGHTLAYCEAVVTHSMSHPHANSFVIADMSDDHAQRPGPRPRDTVTLIIRLPELCSSESL
jgi:hypothetical protein